MDSSSVSIDVDRLLEAEATIQPHLDRLAALDEITKDDLEALRQDLPTDPLLAEALQLALPYPWSELFEYVEATERQTAYWRTSHDRQIFRSAADREHKRRSLKQPWMPAVWKGRSSEVAGRFRRARPTSPML